MLIPLGDDDRRVSTTAYVTGILLLLNVGVFVAQLQSPDLIYRLSAIPYQIVQGVDLVNEIPFDHRPTAPEEIPQRQGPSPIQLTLFTSLFLHGGWLHLGSNMLYLWIFGNNVEHRFGHGLFLLFYVVSGLAGSLAQIAFEPESVVPMLGASGAISGVLGAYLVLFPRNRVYALFFVFLVTVPAVLAIGLWVVMQLGAVFEMLAVGTAAAGGVAYAAHLAGFGAGALTGLAVRIIGGKERRSAFTRTMDADASDKPWW